MARIRTIKPEYFRHEELQDLEAMNPGFYPMLVFSGLWCVCDREGRFEWKPRKLKLDVLPFLDFDMASTLLLLESAGLIIKYEYEGTTYGAVTSWDRHQLVGRDEPPSEIPAPDGNKTPYFKPLNQTQRIKVYERDNWTCSYCGRGMRNDKRAICLDHVIPYSKGGTNREANLTTSCKSCNSQKSDRTPGEAGMAWPVGLGEYLDRATGTVCQHTVNTPLTGGPTPPDKERGREGGKERDKEEEENKELGAPAKKFKPPTPDEVGEYMLEIGYQGNPQQFCDHYTANGWMVGKNKMKDWKAAVRTWRGNGSGFTRGTAQVGAEKARTQSLAADSTAKPAGHFAGDLPDNSHLW